MSKRQGVVISVLSVLAVLPLAAHAHVGQGPVSGVLAGLLHPLAGVDHLLAMLASGLWGACLGARAALAVATVFVTAMLAGVLLAVGGVVAPYLEPGIAVSLLVLGGLAALRLRAAGVGMALVAVSALVHGQVHGAEMAAAPAFGYALGLLLATAGLHAVGIGAGLLADRHGRSALPRAAGVVVGMTGVVLLAVG